jgi:hypothetical protein
LVGLVSRGAGCAGKNVRFISSRPRRRDCCLITPIYFAGTPASNMALDPAADIRTRQNRRTGSAVELLTLSIRAESDKIDRAVSQSSPICAYGSRTIRSLQDGARIST